VTGSTLGLAAATELVSLEDPVTTGVDAPAELDVVSCRSERPQPAARLATAASANHEHAVRVSITPPCGEAHARRE
jgi:hypothetical protein